MTIRIGVFPGSFDPLTIGHLSLIHRGSTLVDRLIVLIATNANKQNLFTVDERLEQVRDVVSDLPNVEVAVLPSDQLVAHYCEMIGANCLIRGVRQYQDYEYEVAIAEANRQLNPHLETIFLVSDAETRFISSSLVKELAHYHSPIEQFVPEVIVPYLIRKFNVS